MGKRIAIVHSGHEGGFFIDATTFQVIQEGDNLPEWAQGVVVGLMGERNAWYEKRLGQNLPQEIMKPQVMEFGDLEWLALDHNGDEVHIEADTEVRYNTLAKYIGLDLSDAESFMNSEVFRNAIARAEIDAGRLTKPTDEVTLAEAEGTTFEQVEKQAIHA